MKGLTAPELCGIVGMKFQRFETLRRRYRDGFDDTRVVDDDTFIFPVSDDFGGGWARYGFSDVLKLAITLELERQGLDFKRAARIAVNAFIPDEQSSTVGDFWIGRQRLIDSNGDAWDPYVGGSHAEVFQPRDPNGTLVSIAACNIAAIEASLRVKLADIGFRIHGNELRRKGEANV